MKLQGLSVKRLFFYVIIGLILSMTVAAAILYFITEQAAVLVVGAVLILCALAWLLALTQILGKKLALFTSDLCGTLDHMIVGNKGISLSEDSETQLARIGHRAGKTISDHAGGSSSGGRRSAGIAVTCIGNFLR